MQITCSTEKNTNETEHNFRLTKQSPDDTTGSLVSPLVRVRDRGEYNRVDFHHRSVHRHVEKGLKTGPDGGVCCHPEGGGTNCK